MALGDIVKETEYLQFKEIVPSFPEAKTQRWLIKNKERSIPLGMILWHSPWRQYVFHPSQGMIFNTGCLKDIVDFITEHKNDRR